MTRLTMPKKILLPMIAFVGGFLAILSGLLAYQAVRAPAAAPADLPGLLWPNPKALTDFELSDQNQQPFNLARIRGRWTLWYFGYTNCPDACPTALSMMNAVDAELETFPDPDGRIQLAFVSVDPARDSLERMARYVEFFNPAIVAATGTDEQLDTLTAQLGVLYVRQEPDAAGNYLVDHSTALLLTDPAGRLVALFRPPHDARAIGAQFRRIVDFVGS